MQGENVRNFNFIMHNLKINCLRKMNALVLLFIATVKRKEI